LFNFNTSSLIQFFIFNGNLLICVVPLNLNSLKFVKCSSSVEILLRESHQYKLRVCNWVNNPICVGSDLIPLDVSERCYTLSIVHFPDSYSQNSGQLIINQILINPPTNSPVRIITYSSQIIIYL
jgi:hypothetical protein